MANPAFVIKESELNHAESGSAKLSAAKAEPKSAANVMATCMVDKNLDEFLESFNNFFAFLFPSSASFSSFAEFKEITAISAAANNAFAVIKNICNNIGII